MSVETEWSSLIDQRFIRQEEAMRELNDKLELRRKELAEKSDKIIQNPGAYITEGIETRPRVSFGEGEGGLDSSETEDGFSEKHKNEIGINLEDDDMSHLELEHQVLGFKGMTSDGKERLLLAKLANAEKEVGRLRQEKASNSMDLENLKAELKSAQEQIKFLQRHYKNAESKAEKTEAALSKTEVGSRDMAMELNDVKQKLQIAKKIAKDLEKSNNAKETKLNRALAEAARYKSLMEEKQVSSKSQDSIWREEKTALDTEINKLRRTKTDLMAIVKKQFKLIDILKKQKMHIEAAKLLSFSEEQLSNHIKHK